MTNKRYNFKPTKYEKQHINNWVGLGMVFICMLRSLFYLSMQEWFVLVSFFAVFLCLLIMSEAYTKGSKRKSLVITISILSCFIYLLHNYPLFNE